MKKLFLAALLALPMIALAEAPVCQHYSQADLENMSMDELNDLQARFTVIVYGDSYSAQTDSFNCSGEYGRVSDVINERIKELLENMKTEAKASGAVAKEQTYEQTVEGAIFKKMKDYCKIANLKDFMGNLDVSPEANCYGYIQYDLAGNNCNPNSDNTPEDIACVGRTFDDVKKYMAADLECNKKFPPTKLGDYYQPNDDPDLNRAKCYRALDSKSIDIAQARRAKWKALGYYPNN